MNKKKYQTGRLKNCMTAYQYNQIHKNSNISKQSEDITYGVLVEGNNLSFYAKKYNISNAAIHQLCKWFKAKGIEAELFETHQDLNILIAVVPETQMPQFQKSQNEICKRFNVDKDSLINKFKILAAKKNDIDNF